MAKTFHLTIAKIGENLFDGEALSVTLPGAEGVFTVMSGHEAFVTPLRVGEARIKSLEGEDTTIAIEGGIAEVSGNQTTVLL
ncbi:MAG: atpC [Parcubacteria group bacterium]|nr:atpC [Parcubacteria group bacterium]